MANKRTDPIFSEPGADQCIFSETEILYQASSQPGNSESHISETPQVSCQPVLPVTAVQVEVDRVQLYDSGERQTDLQIDSFIVTGVIDDSCSKHIKHEDCHSTPMICESKSSYLAVFDNKVELDILCVDVIKKSGTSKFRSRASQL